MAGDETQIEDKSNVLDVEFGGEGPRQVVGTALKDIEYFKEAMVVAIGIDGELYIYHSAMDMKDLALIGANVQGYTLMLINDWEEVE